MTQWTRGKTVVQWNQGGLWIEHNSVGIVVDAPVGTADRIGARLGIAQAIVLSSGRMESVRGLLALLEATSGARAQGSPFSVITSVTDDRSPAIVDVWTRGWAGRSPVQIDALVPGDAAEIAEITLRMSSVSHGEPDGRHPGTVYASPGCAIQITTPDARIAWVPGAAPGHAVRRATHAVDLAIVEVGVVPWPRTERRWRMTLAEALGHAPDVDTVWLVGDDGQQLSGANA